jgi:hypothetical protein
MNGLQVLQTWAPYVSPGTDWTIQGLNAD